MDDDRCEPTDEDLRRRHAASLAQLKRMFDHAEGECHANPIDEEALDAKLDELEEEQ
jgi:hypothetical protein